MSPEPVTGDVGSKLRAARERRGVSLRQIASATKISIGALEALERNDLARLPGGIFSRAFVRSYASEVGLDPDETIQEFLSQLPHDPAVPTQAPLDAAEDHDSIESDRRTASTFLRLIAVSVPIAAAVVYFGTAGRRPAPQAADAAAVEQASTSNASPTHPAAPPVVAGPAIARPAPPAQSAPARAEASRLTAIDVKPDQPSRLTVNLSVTGPCWLMATVDGDKKVERLLQAGDRQTLEVAREVSFTAGDASAVKMTINGENARSLGREGEVVTVRMNLNNFKSYLLVRQ